MIHKNLFNKIYNVSIRNNLENTIKNKIPFTKAIGVGKLWPMGHNHGLQLIFCKDLLEHSHVHPFTLLSMANSTESTVKFSDCKRDGMAHKS